MDKIFSVCVGACFDPALRCSEPCWKAPRRHPDGKYDPLFALYPRAFLNRKELRATVRTGSAGTGCYICPAESSGYALRCLRNVRSTISRRSDHRQASARPCPLDWLDAFCMRNFTGSAEFDDTLPLGDGLLEAGFRVAPARLAMALAEWLTKRGKGGVAKRKQCVEVENPSPLPR